MKLKLAFALFALILAAAGAAKPSFLDRFRALYNPSKTSSLFKAECKTCHDLDNGPPFRNVFGQRLEGLIGPDSDGTPNGGLTNDDLIFVENEDSDGDGYSNLEEIVSGTRPGDPVSHPKSHPTNLPKHVMSRKFKPLHFEVTGGLFLLSVLFGVAAKAAKNAYMGKIAVGSGALGILATVGTLVAWFFSNLHP
jgi:hypothetical protein